MREIPDIGKPDPFTSQVAACLRTLRHQAGWSLDELTQHSGVSRATLSRLEHAEVSPTAAVLAKIASAYEMSVARLISIAEGDTPQFVKRGAQISQLDTATGMECTNVLSPDPAFATGIEDIALPAGCAQAPLPAFADKADCSLFALSGTVTVTREGEEFVLKQGDALRIKFGAGTTLRTKARQTARILLVTS